MIAISYRRKDSQPVAGRVYDRLEAKFGKGNVFMDFSSIPPGVNFREHIKQSLANADVLLVMIGPQWFGKSDKAKNRLEEPNDFVRLEIAEALKHDIPIIPVLIDDTPMPNAESLPEEIQALSYLNGLPLDSGIDFHNHVKRLISGIGKRYRRKALRKTAVGAAFLILILLGLAGAWYLWARTSPQNPAGAEVAQQRPGTGSGESELVQPVDERQELPSTDAVIEQSLTNLHAQTLTFLDRMERTGNRYASQRAFYEEAKGTVSAIKARAELLANNYGMIENLDELSGQYDRLAELHRQGPLVGLKAKIARELFTSNFQSLM
jgi:TIR domain-containing protein